MHFPSFSWRGTECDLLISHIFTAFNQTISSIKQDIDSVLINFDSEALVLLNVCLAIVMFGVALDIKTADFVAIKRHPKAVILGVVSQFLVLPFLTFLLILIIKPLPSIALGMVLVAACPGGNVSNFMTSLAKGNAALSVSLTAIATASAIFMTPLNFELWGHLNPLTAPLLESIRLNPLELFKTITTILAIPLVVGMLVRHNHPTVADRLGKILKPTSIIIFLAFGGAAFSKNLDIFMEYIGYVIVIVFLHNLIGFLAGYSVAHFGKLNDDDKKCLTIETGIQNSGLGLLIIFAFFDGLGGMAIVAAWWGIWHIISGLALATYWSLNVKASAA